VAQKRRREEERRRVQTNEEKRKRESKKEKVQLNTAALYFSPDFSRIWDSGISETVLSLERIKFFLQQPILHPRS